MVNIKNQAVSGDSCLSPKMQLTQTSSLQHGVHGLAPKKEINLGKQPKDEPFPKKNGEKKGTVKEQIEIVFDLNV